MHKNSMNKVVLVGRLGQNPDQKALPSGRAVVNLSVATNETYKNQQGEYQESTEWHRCVAFGKTAEYIGNYFTKGRLVYIDGRLKTRKWEDKNNSTHYTTEVWVDTAMLLGSRSDGDNSGQRSGVYAPKPQNPPREQTGQSYDNSPSMPDNDEELPF